MPDRLPPRPPATAQARSRTGCRAGFSSEFPTSWLTRLRRLRDPRALRSKRRIDADREAWRDPEAFGEAKRATCVAIREPSLANTGVPSAASSVAGTPLMSNSPPAAAAQARRDRPERLHSAALSTARSSIVKFGKSEWDIGDRQRRRVGRAAPREMVERIRQRVEAHQFPLSPCSG